MPLWLLLCANDAKMQRLKSTTISFYHVITWVRISSRAQLGSSNASNGVSWGHWVVFSWWLV